MSKNKTVDLSYFAGKEFVLTGVDEGTMQVQKWSGFEDATSISFRLNNVTYTAVENPDDGYRSSLDHVFVSDDKLKNVFPPCVVLAQHRTKSDNYSGVCDIVDFVDKVTGKTVLSVGTDNVDDYYPGFVSHFDPTAMSVNTAAAKVQERETQREAKKAREAEKKQESADWASW